VPDGLNRPSTINGVSVGWTDGKGNLTSDPTTGKSYGYSSENLLTSGSGGVTLGYDPALRLYQVAGAATTRFAYDGVDAIAEYNSSNALQRRFVFDPTTGQPVVQYEGTGTATPRYLSQDERGSVISLSDGSGASLGLNSYDEFGKPGASNTGRFQYTGQKWLSEIGAYDYKARVYLSHLGVFAQTDPLRQAAGPNLYAYAGDDPVNLVDPFGLDDTAIPVTHSPCSGGSFQSGVCVQNTEPSNPSNTPDTGNPGSDPDRRPPVIVTHHRQRGNKQCVAAPGETGEYERNLSTVASVLDTAATIAAFTGAEPVAFSFELASGFLTFLKYQSQVGRGDTAGARATIAGFGFSYAIGRVLPILRFGGSAQKHFNAGVASALGNAYGKGLEKVLNCE
jgi:RHS repeat-associated protein